MKKKIFYLAVDQDGTIGVYNERPTLCNGRYEPKEVVTPESIIEALYSECQINAPGIRSVVMCDMMDLDDMERGVLKVSVYAIGYIAYDDMKAKTEARVSIISAYTKEEALGQLIISEDNAGRTVKDWDIKEINK